MTRPPSVFLVTGFGAFLDVADNPSARIAARLDGAVIAGLTVACRILPVSYDGAGASLREALSDFEPAGVIALGAGNGPALRLERWARNRIDSAVPDTAGECAEGRDSVPGAPDRLEAVLPLDTWAAALSSPDLAVVPSDDAGPYVCNSTFFALLHALGGRTPGLFVHVPRVLDDVGLALAERAVRGLIGRMVGAGATT